MRDSKGATLVGTGDRGGNLTRYQRKQPIAIAGVDHCFTDDINRQLGQRHGVRMAVLGARSWQPPFASSQVEFSARHAGNFADALPGRNPQFGILSPGAFMPGATEPELVALSELALVSSLKTAT